MTKGKQKTSQQKTSNTSFNFAALKSAGTFKFELSEDGKKLVVISDQPIEAMDIEVQAPKTATAIIAGRKALEIGDTDAEGWIYAGISEDVNSPRYRQQLWVAPDDTVVEYKNTRRDDVPTVKEMLQIDKNLIKKGIGGFNALASDGAAGWYWTNKENVEYGRETVEDAAAFQASTGKLEYISQRSKASLRRVRGQKL